MNQDNYPAHSIIVAAAILSVQPRNGTDYSGITSRQERELIAVNVHLGRPALEGVS